MKTLRSIFIMLLFSAIANELSAHAVWIETAAHGKIGQSQEVKVYFGEYGQDERDKVEKWYSDLKDLTLWLVGPDGTKTQLPTTIGENVSQASFTPQKDGIYSLQISHKSKDLHEGTQYEFLASSHVFVGKTTNQIDPASSNHELQVFPLEGTAWKTGAAVKVQVLHQKNAKSGSTVQVFSPSGWSRELTTAEDGTISFVPLWPGKYVLEASNFSKDPGEANGNQYKALWQGSTYSFEVKK